MAGGISNCADWQTQLRELIHQQCPSLVLLNPRREDFDATNPNMSEQQIEWEHRHLRQCSAVLFYFPPETLCPITLYELGTWSNTGLFECVLFWCVCVCVYVKISHFLPVAPLKPNQFSLPVIQIMLVELMW
jgi:hypothetical protein